MNYKIALPNEKYNMNTGQDTRNFIVKKTEDKVVLRFDEENQLFYAKIENPSQHTKYLFQQHRLAISLSKLNTGKSQRSHMGDNYYPGERYWDEETQEWKNATDFYVKKKCHPRWSRCRFNGVVVHEQISDFSEEIEIPFNIEDLRPNQKHTLGKKWTNWYNSIKAVLVSCFDSLTTEQFNNTSNSGCRAYKTMSNRIKIEYDSKNDVIVERKNDSEVNHWNDYYNLNAHVVDQSSRNFEIQIDSMGSRVTTAFNNNRLWVGIEFLDAGNYSHRGNISKAVKYGDKDRYVERMSEDDYITANENKRYKNRVKSKLICPAFDRVKIYSTDFKYEIPDEPSTGCGAIDSLLVLASAKGHDGITITRYANIVIGMIEGNQNWVSNSSMILWRYQTNVQLIWHSEPDADEN